MKKMLVILVVFLLAAPVWAGETLALTSTLEAEASAIFGVDLGKDGKDIKSGFETTAEFTVKLAMVDASSEELGEGDFYGWIEIKDFEITIDGVDQYPVKKDLTTDGSGIDKSGIAVDFGEINAEMRYGGLYIDLRAGENEVDRASYDVSNVEGATVASVLIDSKLNKPLANVINRTGMGLGIGYKFPVASGSGTIELGLASGYNGTKWYDTNNSYQIAVFLELADLVGGLTIKLNASQWLNVDYITQGAVAASDSKLVQNDNGTPDNYADDYPEYTAPVEKVDAVHETQIIGETAAGIFVQYDYSITDDLILRPAIGFDVKMDKYDALAKVIRDEYILDLQAAAGISLVWPGLGTDASIEDDDDYFEFTSKEFDVTSGVGLGGIFTMLTQDKSPDKPDNFEGVFHPYLDAFLTFYEDAGSAGLVPFMGAQLLVNFAWDFGLKNGDTVISEEYQHIGAALYTNFLVAEMFKPFVGVIFQLYDLGNKLTEVTIDNKEQTLEINDKMNMEVKVGIEIAPTSNTSITLAYATANLLGTDYSESALKGLAGPSNVTTDSRAFFDIDNVGKYNANNFGEVTLEAKVTFGK